MRGVGGKGKQTGGIGGEHLHGVPVLQLGLARLVGRAGGRMGPVLHLYAATMRLVVRIEGRWGVGQQVFGHQPQRVGVERGRGGGGGGGCSPAGRKGRREGGRVEGGERRVKERSSVEAFEKGRQGKGR